MWHTTDLNEVRLMLLEMRRRVRRRIPKAYDQVVGAKRWLLDPYERLLCRIGRRTQWRVAGGPFAGMRYIRRNYGNRWAPRLIGCYEEELHPELERALSHGVRNVVNIGSGDGYYAVGLALRSPTVRVIAYDSLPEKRGCCDEMATLNGVRQQIEIRGTCTAPALAELDLENALVLCDCEGFEEDILDPEIVPWLRKATLIVELHEFYRPQVRQILATRFATTHEMTIINAGPRDPSRYPVLANETPENALVAVKEQRVIADGQPAETPWAVWRPLKSMESGGLG
jgi:hypothetical protein